MVAILLAVILLMPLAAVLLCLLVQRPRPAEYFNLIAAIVTFVAVLWLLPLSLGGPYYFLNGYLIVDALGTWVLLTVASVYLLGSIYAVGYMRMLDEDKRLHRFYALYAGFGLAMLAAPVMNSIGVYWIAIEMTTLISTFLICFEVGRESIEAAWKYIIIVSGGLTLALLGIVLYYWAGSLVLGPTYDMTWAALRQIAPQMNPTLTTAAFLLVLIGFGTKVGLAPMHTWLPDAHSEGPTPVSVMLSGALLNAAMVGIVRFLQISDAAHLGALPRTAVVVLGALSLFIAAMFIVRQTDIKRLMAYSSVEHMGILALGFGFGGPLGIAGALYHMLNHSLNKSLMFFGAGNVMRGYGSKHIGSIRNVLKFTPVGGLLWLAGAVAITGAPPFGLFLSEMTILRAGLMGINAWAAFVMLILLIVIFVGFLNHFRAMYFEHDETSEPTTSPAAARKLSTWCLVPMWLTLIPVLVMGLWWPHWFSHFFAVITTDLGIGVAS